MLTTFLDFIDDDKTTAVEKLEDCKVVEIKDSIESIALLTPYMSMLKGGQSIDVGDFDIAVDKLDAAINKAKGYFEYLGKSDNRNIILRFNNQAFKNSYRASDLQRMELVFYAVKVGHCRVSELTVDNELHVDGARTKDEPDYLGPLKIAETENAEDSEVDMYDVLLAGIETNFSKVIIFNGPTKQFDKLLDEEIENYEENVQFLSVIRGYNGKIRANGHGAPDFDLETKLQADCCIARTNDYGSVLSHAVSNFAHNS